MLGPRIVGERVTLAPMTLDHLEPFTRWFADPLVTRYLLRIEPPSMKQEVEWYEAMCADPNRVNWGVFVGESETLIGTTGIEAINWRHRHASSGTLLGDRSYWGKGLGSETMRLRTAYGFQHLGLEKLKSSAFADNAGSRRSLEKAGYRQSGLERREIFRDGRWHDIVLYEVLREEWERTGVS